MLFIFDYAILIWFFIILPSFFDKDLYVVAMGKFGETKNKIIDLLNQRNMTLSEISERLNLAPSTVSQHLQELEEAGKIKESDEQHSRKWKYYELEREGSENKINIITSQRGRIGIIAASALIAVFIIAYILSIYMPVEPKLLQMSPNMTLPAGATLFTISDSPMQYNISAVYVKLNSISIHSETNGKWYKIPSYETFNLVELRNISKVIAGAEMPYGNYNEVVLNVSNVEATVNGTNESVFLPSGKLRIFDEFNISGNSTNIINFDFNLERSIHIAGDGKIIMMPVIGVGCAGSHNVSTYSGFVTPAHFRNFKPILFGMAANGMMERNATTNISNFMPNIIISSPRGIFIDAVQGLSTGNESFNITVAQRSIKCSAVGEHVLICRTYYNWSGSDMHNITKQVNASISAIKNLTISNANGTQIFNAGYEIMRISGIDPNASISMFSCDSSSQCGAVPATFCQNNWPGQQVCINSAYAAGYMNYYNQARDHKPVLCPMFELSGSSSCSCLNNLCTLIYTRIPVKQ